MHKGHMTGCVLAIGLALVLFATTGGSVGGLGLLLAVLICPITMGAGMMSGDSWESMQAMHEAIDLAVMQQVHDAMVEQLPPELRADAEAMHAQMFPAMTGADGVDHASHHPTGS